MDLGNGFPSIDAFYLICDKFSNEGIHIEDFLRKDGIPLQVEEAAAKIGPKAEAERKEEEEKKKKSRKRRMCKLERKWAQRASEQIQRRQV